MAFCDWLLSLSMTFSRLVYAISYVSISFFFMAEKYSTVQICHILFIHLSAEGHLGFQYWADMNEAVINICIHVNSLNVHT